MELNRRLSPQWISREAVARSVLKFNVCLVTDEQELDQFLGKLISKISRTAGSIIRSPAGKALGGVLKGAAKKALPIAGPASWNVFRGPGGRRHRREARLGCRQNFWPRARRDERRRPGIRSRASFRSSRRFGSPKSCSGSLGSGSRRTAACAWLALAQRGRNSKHGVWRRSGALGSLGSPRTQDHRARRLRREPDTRTLKEERECTTSIQHKGGQNQVVSKPEPESFLVQLRAGAGNRLRNWQPVRRDRGDRTR